MDVERAKELDELLDEIVWRYGGQNPEGNCCEDISYVEYRALRLLARTEACTVQHLGQHLGFTKSGATRIVDRLERKGYARRERGQEDRRVCCVTLTEAGRALVESIADASAQRTGTSLARLDENMREVLVAALRSFVQTFRE